MTTTTTNPFPDIPLPAGAEFGEKILRPLPEYSSDSVTSIASMCRVGSSAAEVVPTCFAAAPGAAVAGLLPAVAAGAGAAATGAVVAGALE